MRGLCQSLPAYVWLAALSQLTSRICHPNTIVQRTTRNIVGKVLQAYPHQVGFSLFIGRPAALLGLPLGNTVVTKP